MNQLLLSQGLVVNENQSKVCDVLIRGERIHRIDTHITPTPDTEIIDCTGLIIIPGVIDDQVHFRQPGLTHKAQILTESRAAILGGITSYMEMPNTVPPTFSIDLLEQKYQIAAQESYANYSFFMGTSNDNLEEIKKLDPKTNCGLKIFMGSSTGNLLVEDEDTLEAIFRNSPTLIATHCEEESIINSQKARYLSQAQSTHDPSLHPIIRNREACIASSQKAIKLAQKTNARLHILHISTAEETSLFSNDLPLDKKRITAEACVHHLWFSDLDYAEYGNQIVCNPAIKTPNDREAIWSALLDHRIDIIATDHAPHTLSEKQQPYPLCPSGIPLIQHSLLMMLERIDARFDLQMLVYKMCHAPAICFGIVDRGYLREGYYADIAIIDPNQITLVKSESIEYKCKWSPFEQKSFSNTIKMTIVNGRIMQKNGKILNHQNSKRLNFSAF